LLRRADEWEAELTDPREDWGEDDDESWGRSDRTEESVDAMFESLLDELDEREDRDDD
jgi:hypothetical protein